jgi:excisionase family DNA binding protein
MRASHKRFAETHWTSQVATLHFQNMYWRFVMFDEKKRPASERSLPILGRQGVEPLLDSNKAAAMLGVHPRTLQRMVLRGEIGGVHVGKLWRFRASAIDAWIERKMVG